MSKQRPQTDYVRDSRNELARTRGAAGAAPPPADADGEPDPNAATRPSRRARTQLSRPLLGWIVALTGALGLLALMLVLWLGGGMRSAPQQRAGAPTAAPLLGSASAVEPVQAVLGGASEGGATTGAATQPTAEIPPVGAAPAAPASGSVSPGFQGFYDTHGGLRILGRPISQALTVNGREIQWFERARIERWPEYAGTPYEIQLGRLGAEYTSGRDFATQQFFASRPDLRYFPETNHALGGAFLAFWEQNGGVPVFGLPISEEFDEVLPDGKAYRVQYFERARLELHPENAGTPYEVQVGLLGTALYQNDSRPDTIQPAPTAVPMP